jgi:hypothetical protein
MKFRKTFCALALCALVMGCPSGWADTIFTMTREIGTGNRYTAGETVNVTVTMSLFTDGSLNALGLEDLVPEGWTYDGLVSGQLPDVTPNMGEGGLLEFSWVFSIPENFPFTFTYRLNVPSDEAGGTSIVGRGIALISETEEQTDELTTFALPEGLGPYHSSDLNSNQVLSLSEVLRIVQFYNAGGYRCGLETEDGYVPGTVGPAACDPHSGDYNPADFTIALSELLRHIQTFNAGFYTFCPTQGTEDGFCPLAP